MPMTLRATLPWRACPAIRLVRLQGPIAAARCSSPTIDHRGRLRPYSTEQATASPDAPDRSNAPDAAATEMRASLVDRLRHVPVRPHGAAASVVVKPLTPLRHRREADLERQRIHNSLFQQSRLDEHRVRPQPGDWRVILQNLIAWTPMHTKPSNGVKVVMPPSSTELLLSDHGNNVWNIKSRTGCDMTLYRPRNGVGAENDVEVAAERDGMGMDEGEGEGEGEGNRDEVDEADEAKAESQSERGATDPYIVLTGQPGNVAAAVEDILKVTKEVLIVRLQDGYQTVLHDESDGFQFSVVHYDMSIPNRPYKLTQRADQIPKPEAWTCESLERYIAALTMGRIGGVAARKLYRHPDTHESVVERLLREVFDDPTAAQALSNPALKLALKYLVNAGESRSGTAWALFWRARHLRLRMDTDVFNLLLETSVRSKNLLAFQSILRRMIRRGQRPNLRTWRLFLRVIEAEEVRRYIIHSMHAKNFFVNPKAVNQVADEMAAHDAYRAMQLGLDADAFLAAQRELYGPEWRLQRYGAHKILHILGLYGRFDDVKKLLAVMFDSQQSKPNTATLNTVLARCKAQGRLDQAIEFVRMFSHHGQDMVADYLTFRLFADMARKLRRLHLLGAVVRYAHLRGKASGRVRWLTTRILTHTQTIDRLTGGIRSLWDEPSQCSRTKADFMERIVLCDDTGDPEKAQTTGGKKGARATSSASPSEPSTEPEPKQSRVERYGVFCEWATKLAIRWLPATPLGDVLQAALDLDRKLYAFARQGPEAGRPAVPPLLENPLPLRLKRKVVLKGGKKDQKPSDYDDEGTGYLGQGEDDAIDEEDDIEEEDEDEEVGARRGGRGIRGQQPRTRPQRTALVTAVEGADGQGQSDRLW